MMDMKVPIDIALMLISAWDLEKKEIPIPFLILLSGMAVLGIVQEPVWKQLTSCLFALLLSGVGIAIMRKKMMGGGDVWVLACLILAWPIEVFWESMMLGTMVLCLVALGVWRNTQDAQAQIPMIPFLLIGYWMRG